MIQKIMGEFHERKVLSAAGAVGLTLSLLQSGTNPLQGMIIAAVTVVGVILGDIYWCGKEPFGYRINEHVRKLGLYGGLATASFLVLLIPSIMFLIGGILIVALVWKLYQHEALTEDELMSHWMTFVTALLFFLVYFVPELFLIPILFLFGKFVMAEWPNDEVKQ